MNGTIHQHTGHCPRCGAPIFAVTKTPIHSGRPPAEVEERLNVSSGYVHPLTSKEPPTAHFTCECRKTLPQPLPDVSDLVPGSTDEEDRKWLAKHRAQSEPKSGERVSDD